MATKYLITDYKNIYGSIMHFNKNKNKYIHGWYPFVEGYSKEFILSILSEYKQFNGNDPQVCLEPFAGSGTTPLELQKKNIKCYSFEVSPFMYNLSLAKLETSYTTKTFDTYYNLIKTILECSINIYCDELLYASFKTIVEKEGIKKWNFNKEVMYGIIDIKNAITNFKSKKYIRLFTIALSSILLEVSNVYRNGKCISYKKNWETNIDFTRKDVHKIFLEKLESVYFKDIIELERHRKKKLLFSNAKYCYFGDSRKLVYDLLDDESIDLVITSPPYLNSRDYTDTYIVELRVLGYLNTHNDVRSLRENTLRSHVQVKWGEIECLEVQLLKDAINELSVHSNKFWNKELINMINGYFMDMDNLFKGLYKKMKKNGMVFFNIANSAYCNVEIKVDEIISEIAETNGFLVKEIREARRIKPSSQQKEDIESLRESVIVMIKPAY